MITPSHAVSSIRQCLYYQYPVFISPPSHIFVGFNLGVNKVNDVLLLSALVVEGYAIGCQGSEGVADIDLGTTCYAQA